MKTVYNNKLTQAICTISMVLVLTCPALAYPPDNAAVLYYRASLAYDANDAMMDKVMKFNKGDAEIDDEIRKYIETIYNISIRCKLYIGFIQYNNNITRYGP